MSKKLLRIAFADDDTDDHLFFFDAIKSKYRLPIINSFFNSDDLLHFFIKERNVIPHIFFLDKNMPGNMNYECLIKIKETPLLSAVPVIIYSTSGKSYEINEAINYGATSFIIKPVSFTETVHVLRSTIEEFTSFKFEEKEVNML